tara:strand:- start:33 stop:476 length:444 start_codon:yes stop_codon:yes gene_type:complete
MHKTIFIYSNSKKISHNQILNQEKKIKIFYVSKKIKRNFFKNILKKIKKNDDVFFIFKNEQNNNLENKIYLLSEFLEIINKLKIKNAINIINDIKNKKGVNYEKLEKKIISEIVFSYNNMFRLNINFYNFQFKKNTQLNELINKLKY